MNRPRPRPSYNPNGDEREECPTCGGPVPSPRPTRRRVATPSPSKCPDGQVCCRLSRAGGPQTSVPQNGSCGRRSACGVEQNRQKQNRGESNVGEYPWVVSRQLLNNITEVKMHIIFQAMILHVAKSGRKEFLCNGALIDQRRILTVAQCVEAFE